MKKRTKIRIRAAVAGMTLAAVFLCGCTMPFKDKASEKATEEATEEGLEVGVASPEVKSLAVSSNFSGTVVAESEVNVTPLTSGEVIEKNFEVGDHVNAGDLLFKIDDEAYQIALKQAEASVTTAQAGLTSAQANLNSAEANANTTRAKAIQDVGEIPYNEQSMNVKVDTAYVSKRSANNTFKNAQDNVELQESTLDDLEDALDAARSARDTAKNHYEELKNSGTATPEEIEAAEEAYEACEAVVDTAKDKVEQQEYTVSTAKRSADNAEMNAQIAYENYQLDQMQRDNYNTYTKATTIYSAYGSAVGADTSVTNSKATVTSSAAGVKSAQAGLENAQLNLEHTNVKAPVSGTITAINVVLHNMASTQSAAYTIESDEPNKIVFYVAEETARNIIPGADATVTKNGTDYKGKILNVYDTVDSGTGLFKVEATVSDPAAAGTLITGLSVTIKTTTRRADQALTVPINAVYYDGEQAYLYVDNNGTAKRLDVTTGLSDDESVEITDGLTADAKVIVTWSGSLRDGTVLKVADAGSGTAAKTPAPAEAPQGAMVVREPSTGDNDDAMIAAGAGEQ